MPFYLYILQSEKDGTLYTGQTANLKERILFHNTGKCKSTKAKIPYKLVYYEMFQTRSESMYREWEIKKKWNIERKRKLIESFDKSKIIKLFTESV